MLCGAMYLDCEKKHFVRPFTIVSHKKQKKRKNSLQSKDYVVELYGNTVFVDIRRRNEKGKKDIS